ncbi:phospho-sugar mutase [Haemophilus parahaemolyticus]|uniref:Phospho-sugar mutase n=2 Tax=Haemophilus parahaemolyticus TaxID=735 RepID=A0AAE6JR16_HAEPH|nr:phospho-sugar mutase [Haemophilus parahaemolyticus]EIJ70785.1 phosphoglucomutase/phosphomannomutase, alpha/beta/alpha domain I [Haemophilus parahaemolyticus HK385]OOR97031.1 alpha-D-phosphohexomutase [Haemophilus parahaemolyticus]QEN11030.1 phospho-sugar mutase [Haemophilus parahaemolyticus]QRP12223.1 phospho-sugar mutase [Haemophilus parahaemolyticus]STO67002.1 phosphomannomutase [Haemophilus parahaemolyticus HK385]
METLFTTAQNWLNQDPDQETRAELEQLIAEAKAGKADAQAELANRFNGRLQFGTAGLRGRLQAGSMGMNRVLVAQAAGGLAEYLKGYDKEPSIVIGYDGRKNSDVFARDTAEIMAGAGIKAYLLPRKLPTPVLAYAIQYFDTTAGVMVTASHNPPEDNGYKVYLGKANGGGQIVSPADKEIAALIDKVAAGNIADLPRSQNFTVLSDEIVDAYIAKTASLAKEPACDINYVYTAMHGVGYEVLSKTLAKAGLPQPHVVAEQVWPDGTFPTVNFPNPEEKGALDLAIEVAKKHNAEFIIANDPDADRLAVALPDAEGNWKPLHGNVIGCYLGWYLAKQYHAQGKKGVLACSLVSSPALAEIAKKYGFDSEETLTGFKYIGKVNSLLFGFEEALGYLVDPDKVRDKDGISAAIVFLDLVRSLKKEGKTLADYAADFTKEFGAYVSGQISIRVSDLSEIGKLMSALRHNPPEEVGGFKVATFLDHTKTDRQSDILVFVLENGSRLIARPSGTEPKIKFYLDARGTDPKNADEVLAQFDESVRVLLRQEQYGKQDC